MPHEPLQLLRRADGETPAPTARWLEAAALVLANRTSTPAARALQAWSCPGADIELWQAVLRAADGPLPQQTLASEAIGLRLAAYPPALRVELALRLAEAGIDAKAPEGIAVLLDMVEQAAPADEAKARLLFLRGRLAAARGDFAGARASWREALDLQGEGSLLATLALLESDLEHDELDEAWALSALERLAYDWRGHPAQLSIARLTAAVHERQGHVQQALRALEEVALGAQGQPSGRAAARLATDLMRRAYADAPSDLPIDQLAAFWRYEGFVPPGSEGEDVRLAFARALTAHGLPNSAVRLLEPLLRNAHGPLHDQVIDLLAEGYLATHQPAEALGLLRATAKETPAPRPAATCWQRAPSRRSGDLPRLRACCTATPTSRLRRFRRTTSGRRACGRRRARRIARCSKPRRASRILKVPTGSRPPRIWRTSRGCSSRRMAGR